VCSGPFHRVPYEGPIANPCERIIHARGSYVEALVNICYSFIYFASSIYFDAYGQKKAPLKL